MLEPQAGSFSDAGSGIAHQASSFVEAAATSATDSLLLNLDTLWSFVQEVRPLGTQYASTSLYHIVKHLEWHHAHRLVGPLRVY